MKDDRFVMIGADIEVIEACELPVAPPPLFLAAKLLLMPDEPEEGHWFRVDISGPQAERKPISGDKSIQSRRDRRFPARPTGCNIIAPVNLVFETAAEYRLHLIVDGTELKVIPLLVSNSVKPVPTIDANLGPLPTSTEEAESAWKQIEEMAPSDEDLAELAKRHPAPAEWYENG